MIEQSQKTKPANTYWVHEHLLAGDYPGEKPYLVIRRRRPHMPFVEELLALGVSCFIDLTEECEQARPSADIPYVVPYQDRVDGKAEYHRFPVRDVNIPDVRTTLAILNAIDAAIATGRIVYVHCQGGVGRTGTIIGCHLVRRDQSTGDEAIEKLRHLWRHCGKSYRETPETDEQRDWIRAWPDLDHNRV